MRSACPSFRMTSHAPFIDSVIKKFLREMFDTWENFPTSGEFPQKSRDFLLSEKEEAVYMFRPNFSKTDCKF